MRFRRSWSETQLRTSSAIFKLNAYSAGINPTRYLRRFQVFAEHLALTFGFFAQFVE